MKQPVLLKIIGVGFALLFVFLHTAQAATFDIPCGDTAALISAINAANANGVADTINLAADCTYTFTSGDATNPDSALPRITTPITIEGNGAILQRQSTSPNFRLFFISGTGTLTVNNVRINGGRSDSHGGGIYIAGGILTVTNTTVSANDANLMGGGIYNTTSGTLTVTNSVFSGNSTGVYGGAIRSDGVMTVTGTIFTGNTAVGTTTGGGAISNNGTATISGSSFSGNSSKQTGGAITIAIGTMTIIDSVFSDNHAALGGGGSGGGIASSIGTLTVIDSIITGNSAIAGGGISSVGSTLIVTGSTISGNTAVNRGGGITTSGGTLDLTNSAINGNRTTADTSTANGGGIYNNTSTATVINSLIAGNATSSLSSGGGIYNQTALTVINSTIAANNAASGREIYNNVTLTVNNSIVWGSSSPISGQPATVTYSNVQGGYTGTGNLNVDPLFISPQPYTIAPSTGGNYHLQSASPVINMGSNAAVTTATDIDGEARIQYGTVDIGADEVNYCPLYVSPYTVAAGNTADFVRAIHCANANPDESIIHLTNSTYSFTAGDTSYPENALPIVFAPLTIVGNGATLERVTGSPDFRLLTIAGDVTLDQVIIRGGRASGGGGISVTNGTLTIKNSTITENTATRTAGLGGGIYNAATLIVQESTITSNVADYGGAIFNYNASTTITSSRLFGNGDVELVSDYGTLTIANSIIAGDNTGTGISNFEGIISIINSTVSGHEHAISNDSGSLTIVNSIVWGNNYAFSPGGIHADVTHSIVEGGYTGTGNIDSNPLFLDAANGEYRLQADSPALNKGRNASLPQDTFDLDGDTDVTESMPFDLDGNPRIVNGAVDIGAYEHQTLAGVTVSKTNAAVTEGGTTDTYTVRLNSRPSATVTIDLSIGDQATVSPVSLTFTVSNWSVAQAVTVTAVNDDIVDGTQTDTISHSVESTDIAYDGMIVGSVSVSVTDDDTAGVTVEPTVEVMEGSATDTYAVVLTSEPTADVTITPTGDANCSVSGALTFTNVDWDTPQNVTVTAVDDDIAEGTHGCTITNAAVSSDLNYNDITVANIAGTVADNEAAGVTIEQTVDVTEGGATATYTVVLISKPSASVIIAPTGDIQCTVSVALTFTDVNWDIPQAVTVTAVDDAIPEGDHTCTISHTIASEDTEYDSAEVPDVTGNITDDDAFPAELLDNGGFEEKLHGWTVKNSTGDKRLCKLGKPYAGQCAFKFRGSIGEKAQLSQNVDLSGVTLNAGDTLTLSAFFKGNNLTAKTKFILVVTYVGNPTPVKSKMTVYRNAVYTQVALPAMTLSAGGIEAVKVIFNHKSTAGNLFIDGVSLIHSPLGGRRSSDVLPPPEVPDGFRSGN